VCKNEIHIMQATLQQHIGVKSEAKSTPQGSRNTCAKFDSKLVQQIVSKYISFSQMYMNLYIYIELL